MVKGDTWYGILVYPGVVPLKHVDNQGFEHVEFYGIKTM